MLVVRIRKYKRKENRSRGFEIARGRARVVMRRRDGTRIRVASPLVSVLEVVARRNTICDGKTAREKEAYESQNRKTNDGSSA